MTAFPVVDLQRVDNAGPRSSEATKLLRAAEWSGIFLVRNHGIDAALLRRYDDLLQRAIFDRPFSEKARLASPTGHPERGWRAWPDDQGRLEMERYIIGRFDHRWDAALAGVPAEYLHLYEHENVWPEDYPQFQPTATLFFAETRRLAKRVLAILADGLGLPATSFLPPGVDSSHLGANLYAEWPADAHPPKVYVDDHADGGVLTVLHRAGDHLGLEVEVDGQWLAVPIVPDTLTINIGDLGTVWTNGRLRAARHRVLAGGSRASTAVFYQPSLQTTVAPLLPPLPHGEDHSPVVIADKERDAVERYLQLWGRPEQRTAWATRTRYIAPLVV